MSNQYADKGQDIFLYGTGANVISNSLSTKNTAFSVRCLLDPLTVVTNDSVSSITDSSATCGGNVKADGGAEVTARGVCWSTSQNPTIADSHTTDGTGKGSFTSTMKGLKPNNTYYVRAYAINGTDTLYGSQLRFLTKAGPCPGTPTVTDIDDNTYNTVQIGSQCWMAQNLRTTHYADGTYIAKGNSSSSTIRYRYFPNSDTNNVNTYGHLYNAMAAMNGAANSSANPSGVQGICPDGWHVPSKAEWEQLFNYVKNQSEYICGNNSTFYAKALASTTGWKNSETSCVPGKDTSANNATGFSMVPAGRDMGGNPGLFGEFFCFWSATMCTTEKFYVFGCHNYDQYLSELSNQSAYIGYSVRCLLDPLTVVTETPSSITDSSATCGGNVKADGGAEVTARGVCWSTSPNPTIADSHTTDGTGLGSFTSSLKGLKPNNTYYVRAYATNSEGTSYGSQLSFTAKHIPCPGVPTVTDIDGNTYNTVQIGNQCWMKENLRTTKYANGDSIQYTASTKDSSNAYRYFPNKDTNNVNTYGYLYNWAAVMKDAPGSDANPSGVQGICPEGWHVPSNSEWTQLSNYVKSVEDYLCGGSSNRIASALSSATVWTYGANDCAVGHDTSSNNATGFSAVPAGQLGGSQTLFTIYAYFYSATQRNDNKVYCLALGCNNAAVSEHYFDKYYGFSVRCLRDPLTVTTDSAGTVTNNSATLYGKVTSLGKYTTVNAGFRYGTSTNAMTNRTAETEKTANGIYSVALTSLAPNSTYYFQAYAYNGTDTVYGRVIDFKTASDKHCPDIYTITDHEGNMYNTVQIGNQCWMAENMRCTTSPNGSLQKGETNSSSPKYYTISNTTLTLRESGLLYNWYGALDTTCNTSYTNRRGICPEG